LPDGGIEHRRTTTLRGGDTILLGDDTVHAVANPSQEWTGAIHVYGGDYFREGRRMWTDPEDKSAPFDVDLLREVLNEAAVQAKAAAPNG
jgi:predicted metal-dependent enzyme (double-stranded beta helix superfamily)